MAESSFFDRIKELQERVPKHDVKAVCEVDQVYAHYQHEDISYHRDGTPSGTLHYKNGGGAKYLERPWLDAQEHMMKHFADGLLEEHGLQDAATDIAEDGARMVFENAPLEFGDLRESGHPTVEVDGVVVYDRPPVSPRLSEAELREKGHLRDEFGAPVPR